MKFYLAAIMGLAVTPCASRAADVNDQILTSDEATEACTGWGLATGDSYFGGKKPADVKAACEGHTAYKSYSQNVIDYCRGAVDKKIGIKHLFTNCLDQIHTAKYDKDLLNACGSGFPYWEGGNSDEPNDTQATNPQRKMLDCTKMIAGASLSAQKKADFVNCPKKYNAYSDDHGKNLFECMRVAAGAPAPVVPGIGDARALQECQGQVAKLTDLLQNLKQVSASSTAEKLQHFVDKMPEPQDLEPASNSRDAK